MMIPAKTSREKRRAFRYGCDIGHCERKGSSWTGMPRGWVGLETKAGTVHLCPAHKPTGSWVGWK